MSGDRPSWFVDSENNLTLLDEELVDALRDETARGVLHEVTRLLEWERRIVRQFEEKQDRSDDR